MAWSWMWLSSSVVIETVGSPALAWLIMLCSISAKAWFVEQLAFLLVIGCWNSIGWTSLEIVSKLYRRSLLVRWIRLLLQYRETLAYCPQKHGAYIGLTSRVCEPSSRLTMRNCASSISFSTKSLSIRKSNNQTQSYDFNASFPI